MRVPRCTSRHCQSTRERGIPTTSSPGGKRSASADSAVPSVKPTAAYTSPTSQANHPRFAPTRPPLPSHPGLGLTQGPFPTTHSHAAGPATFPPGVRACSRPVPHPSRRVPQTKTERGMATTSLAGAGATLSWGGLLKAPSPSVLAFRRTRQVFGSTARHSIESPTATLPFRATRDSKPAPLPSTSLAPL